MLLSLTVGFRPDCSKSKLGLGIGSHVCTLDSSATNTVEGRRHWSLHEGVAEHEEEDEGEAAGVETMQRGVVAGAEAEAGVEAQSRASRQNHSGRCIQELECDSVSYGD